MAAMGRFFSSAEPEPEPEPELEPEPEPEPEPDRSTSELRQIRAWAIREQKLRHLDQLDAEVLRRLVKGGVRGGRHDELG